MVDREKKEKGKRRGGKKMEENGGSYGRRDDWLAEAGLEGGVGRLLPKEFGTG